MYCRQCGKEISEKAQFCQNCGNKIEEGSISNITYTSPYLRVSNNNTTTQYTHSISSSTYTRVQKKESFPWVIIAIVFVILIFLIAIDDANDVDADLTPVAEPKSGTILSGREYFNSSEITVTASKGSACVVKIKTPGGVEVLSFYVRAGQTVTVGVPDAYLSVLFATGSTWYGNYYLFGKHTNYTKDEQIKDFAHYTYEYTLQQSNNGNFDPKKISEDEFK